ncbi:MAG: rubrerythrin family protein [Muribaculaceae bacterium]|nr:rubrerythrin family protein [Muribaculaceae bacterium]
MDKKSIRGTRTEANLLKAFAGESQARGRYTIFAEVACNEGYEQIAAIFMETAEQEFSHAKRFFSMLDEGFLEITATYPAGPVGDTARNLAEAAAGEHEEWADMYAEFARVAREEGFNAIGALFDGVAKVEQTHEARYLALLERVKTGTVFTSDDADTQWQCRYCGYVHTGKSAPRTCPVCMKPQAYFQRRENNY